MPRRAVRPIIVSRSGQTGCSLLTAGWLASGGERA
jgi:hypothetical protein